MVEMANFMLRILPRLFKRCYYLTKWTDSSLEKFLGSCLASSIFDGKLFRYLFN